MKYNLCVSESESPITKASDIDIKSDYIVRQLIDYDVCDARDAVAYIEKHGIDKFDFDYPYGSFEEYKKHVLAGEFDVHIEDCLMTPEHRAEINKLVKEKKLWITR